MIMAQSKAVATKYKEEKDNEKTKNSIVFDSGHDTGAGRLRGKKQSGKQHLPLQQEQKALRKQMGAGSFLIL